MSMERSRIGHAVSEFCRAGWQTPARTARLGLAAALGATLVLCGPDAPRAQQRNREPEVTITGINASGNTVSITASGSLNRAQLWQDEEGYHVVLPNGQTALGGAARGVKVRRVGNSLELIVPVKPGASVTVQPRGERLDLVVNGGMAEAAAAAPAVETRAPRASAREAQAATARPESFEGAAPRPERPRPQQQPSAADAKAVAGASPKAAPAAAEQPAVAGPGGDAPPEPEVAEAAPAQAPPVEVPVASANMQAGESLGSFLFTLPLALALFGLGLAGALVALVLRRRRKGDAGAEVAGEVPSKKKEEQKSAGALKEEKQAAQAEAATAFEQLKGDRRTQSVAVPFDRRRSGPGAEDAATREQKTLEGRGHGDGSNPALPSVSFGAYRIDQEVSLLVAGRQHCAEALASRAPDDRRAVATSLRKALREADADGRRRAMMALEDYGFVARECASLLLGAESFERASAAHALGEMRSPQSLPFLTEALYDTDPVVRMAAVQGLGELGLPSAIGALLDTARRHPEIPSGVIGPALTACSVESLELPWQQPAEGRAESFTPQDFNAGDVRMMEPLFDYEELPDWLEDEALASALSAAESADADRRAEGAHSLAQFQVRRAVEALARLATEDAESVVRATAVTSLGLVNHESVFVPVIVAMADGAREVRAAAARALSRLSFDRADAYVRVFETADARTLREVARSCVVAGLVGQAINRLHCEDRRQGYEAFSLLSLAVKAGEVGPLVEAIERHQDVDVRLACVGLLGQTHEPELAERLQLLAEHGGVPERVRAALRQTLARRAHAEHEPAPVAK